MSKKNNNKGFTLAELLIVVAIIAVLVAIAIPIFTKRLEASRETTDLANLRSAYAAGQVAVLAGDTESGTYGFDPDASTGLTAKSGTGAKIGKGTKVDGGIDNQKSGVPSAISAYYSCETVASGQDIKIIIEDGSLKEVKFS